MPTYMRDRRFQTTCVDWNDGWWPWIGVMPHLAACEHADEGWVVNFVDEEDREPVTVQVREVGGALRSYTVSWEGGRSVARLDEISGMDRFAKR